MAKAAEAFRTIGEVSEVLDVPKHVLRFWEGKFPQVKPMKRGGGRRYYRPEDLQLLRGIRYLPHAEGYTIKGVQKILREQGIDQVKDAAGMAEAAAAQAAQPKKRGRRAIVRNKAAGKSASKQAGNRKQDNYGSPSQFSEKMTASSPAYLETAIRKLEYVRSLLIEIGAGPAAEPVNEAPARAARR